MRLLVSVALVAHLAVSYAFQSGCFSLRSNQGLRSNVRAKSCDLKMAAMVNVNVQEKTGVKSFTCEKEEVLRTAMLENNVELYYTMKGKLWNCNGGGNCGTCKVELLSGPVTPRTDAEKKLLAKDPATYRLACQTCVLGQVTVRNKPDA